MTVSIEPLRLATVLHVVQNMRQSDWVEIVNLVPTPYQTVDGIAMLTMSHSGSGFVALVEGIPTAVVQLAEIHKGAWGVGLYATDDFLLCWRRIVKEVRAVLFPQLIEFGARYVEAHVLADNLDGQRLLEFIGFRCRSEVLTNYGAFGKDFLLFTLTEADLPHVFQKPKDPAGSSAG